VPDRKPRLLVLNQYYWPGVEATAHLLGDLCRGLADDFEITVVTGRLRDVAPDAGTTEHDGVRVVRVNSTAYDRRNLWLRATNYVTYLVQSFRAALAVDRPDVVLCMTDPPIIANVALVVARRFHAPLVVISQDVFPEVAVELKRLENPLLVGALRAAIRYYLRRADRIVAIGETMRARLEQKGARASRLRIIPNWVDTTAITPQARDNQWALENDLVDKFVVMHSGNVGNAQNLDALVRSATFLRDLDNLRIVIIGTGARHADLLELAERLDTERVVFLPYQDRSVLPLSLATADVHVVGLARGLSGYVVPSRLYGILAAARPVIVAADDDSETAQLARRVGCGVVVPPGRPERLAATIRRAYDGELDLAELGKRGREYVVVEADRRVAVDRYRELLLEVLR
jgi:putative colanic acid biosynthesis glycosyltransferase WcaI